MYVGLSLYGKLAIIKPQGTFLKDFGQEGYSVRKMIYIYHDDKIFILYIKCSAISTIRYGYT